MELKNLRLAFAGKLDLSVVSSVLFLLFFLISSSHSTPINRQAGISENVYITVQNDTYGNEQRVCSIESMTYEDGESIPTSSPCEHCICRPPGFACTIISCEYRPGCKAMKRSNQCCPEYQCECEKDGKIYQNGEKILDENNPCEICYCQGGDVVCAVIDCYWRNDCQPRYIENRCCPLYDHCAPPSDIGPIRPTQRPLITSPTTVPPSILWFNLSSAVYSTKATTEKPIRFQTSTQTVPVPDVPLDHFLLPPHIPPAPASSEDLHSQTQLPATLLPPEVQPPPPVKPEVVHPPPQSELPTSSESVELHEVVPAQILEFPPAVQSEPVQAHPVPTDDGASPQPDLPGPIPSQVPDYAPPEDGSVVGASVQPEIPAHVNPLPESENQDLATPPEVPQNVQDSMQEKVSLSQAEIVLPIEPEAVQPIQSVQTLPDLAQSVQQQNVEPEIADSHDDSLSQPEAPQVQDSQQQVEQAETSPQVPEVPPPTVQVPLITPEQADQIVPTQQQPEQPAAGEALEVSTEAPQSHDSENYEQIIQPLEPSHEDQHDHVPGNSHPDVPSIPDIATDSPVEIQPEIVPSTHIPETSLAHDEISPSIVSHEESSNILEIPPAVLESSEAEIVHHENTQLLGSSSTISLTEASGFVTSLSTETVTHPTVTSESHVDVIPSTTVIHSQPSIVVIPPEHESQADFGIIPELIKDVAVPAAVTTVSSNEDSTLAPTVQPETPSSVVEEIAQQEAEKPVSDGQIIEDAVHDEVEVTTGQPAQTDAPIADAPESEVPTVPQIIIPDQSQEVAETPAPVIVQSEIMVNPESTINDAVDPTPSPVETAAPYIDDTPAIGEVLLAVQPVPPVPEEAVYADEPPYVMVEVDSIFPGGIQADQADQHSDVNEIAGIPADSPESSGNQEDSKPPTEFNLPVKKVDEDHSVISEEAIPNGQTQSIEENNSLVSTKTEQSNANSEDQLPSKENSQENVQEVANPSLHVAKPEYIVISDYGGPIPSIVLQPPQHDFNENQILQISHEDNPKVAVYLQPPKDVELVFEPVILSHVKPLEAEPEIAPPAAMAPPAPDSEALVPNTEQPTEVVPSEHSDVNPVDSSYSAAMQDDINGEATPTTVPLTFNLPAQNADNTDFPVAHDDTVQVPENPEHSQTISGNTDSTTLSPSTSELVSGDDSSILSEALPLNDEAIPVFDERPADVQSKDQTTLPPLIEFNHATSEMLSDGEEFQLHALPPISGDFGNLHDDSEPEDVQTTTHPEAKDFNGRADLDVTTTVQPQAVAADDANDATEPIAASTTETKYRLDMSIFDDSEDINAKESNSQTLAPTTIAAPLPTAAPLQQIIQRKSEDVPQTTTLPFTENELVFDEGNHVLEEVVQNDEGAKETTTYRTVEKSRAEVGTPEVTTGFPGARLDSTDVAGITEEVSITEGAERLEDESQGHTTQFDLSQHHHLSDDIFDDGTDLTTTRASVTGEYPEKNLKKNETNEDSGVEATTRSLSSSEEMDDTVIIDREELTPQFRMPPHLVNKVEPISDDIENVAAPGRSDLTVQQQADNEVANAEETWFWRTFNRVRTMPLFLPAAPSARRPRRSTHQETEHYVKGQKVAVNSNNLDASSEKTKIGWSFPRFLFW